MCKDSSSQLTVGNKLVFVVPSNHKLAAIYPQNLPLDTQTVLVDGKGNFEIHNRILTPEEIEEKSKEETIDWHSTGDKR
jgi:hypothetical protein